MLVGSGARARVGSAPELPVASLGQNLRALGFGRARYHPHFFRLKTNSGSIIEKVVDIEKVMDRRYRLDTQIPDPIGIS